jgi:uncharacterized protein YggE
MKNRANPASSVIALVAGVGLAAAFTLACRGPGASAVAAPPVPPVPRQIVVEGIATLDVPPDRVDVTLRLEARHARPTSAASELERRAAKLHLRLKATGVPSGDIGVAFTAISPEHRYEAGQTHVIGYIASTTYRVTVSDPRSVARVLEAGTDSGVVTAFASFRSSKMPEMKKRVREMALGAAKEKAQQIARSLGVTLGQALTATEGAYASHQGGRYYWAGSAVSNVQGTVTQAHQSAGGGAAEAGLPNHIPLHLTMAVTFAIH